MRNAVPLIRAEMLEQLILAYLSSQYRVQQKRPQHLVRKTGMSMMARVGRRTCMTRMVGFVVRPLKFRMRVRSPPDACASTPRVYEEFGDLGKVAPPRLSLNVEEHQDIAIKIRAVKRTCENS